MRLSVSTSHSCRYGGRWVKRYHSDLFYVRRRYVQRSGLPTRVASEAHDGCQEESVTDYWDWERIRP